MCRARHLSDFRTGGGEYRCFRSPWLRRHLLFALLALFTLSVVEGSISKGRNVPSIRVHRRIA